MRPPPRSPSAGLAQPASPSMDTEIFIGLIRNAALLISLGLFYDLLPLHSRWQTHWRQQLLTGLALGLIGIAVMSTPWTLTPGVVFDTRTVLLSITGLFFGPLPTGIAMLLTAALRLLQGGAGAITGVIAILLSGSLGLVWRYRQGKNLSQIRGAQLYIFGLCVHLLILATFLTLPWPVAQDVLVHLSLPIMVIHPISTLLLGLLLCNRLSRKQMTDALRESEQRWQFALEGAGDGVWDWNAQTNQVFFSYPWKKMLGYEEDEITDQLSEWESRVHPDDLDQVWAAIRRHVDGGSPLYTSEHRLRGKDGKYRWILDRGKIVSRTPDGKPLRIIGTHTDITARRQAEDERHATIELLRLINTTNDHHALVRTLIVFLKNWSGCEAVGIRLQDGEDFPYFETRGFPEHFVKMENSLCVRDPQGLLLRDPQGNPVLECMCGNILRGRFNPDKPFFTQNGSFWTNCTSELLRSTSESDRQARTRNRCNGEGYESVALIPLRTGQKTLGLIQFNDKSPGRFSPESITLFERLGDNIANFLAKTQIEKELRASQQRYRTLYEYSALPVWEEDFTTVKAFFDQLRAQGVQDLRAYFETHPEAVTHCAGLVKVLDINEQNLRFFNVKEKGAILTTLPSYFREDSLDIFRDELIALAGGATQFQCEIPIYLPDHSKRMLGFHLSVVPGYEDSLALVLFTFWDITEQRIAETKLRESEQLYRQLFEMESDAIFLIENESGKILQANLAATHLYGYSQEELVAMRNTDLSAEPEETQRVTLGTPVVVENRVTIPLRWHRKRDGAAFPVEITGRFFLHQGRPVHVAAIRDITARRQAEESITTALHEKEILLRELYHRTKNNMQVIRSMLVLQSANSKNAEVRRLVSDTGDKIQAMALVHQMLYQSKNLSSINLQTYIEELATLILSSHHPATQNIHLRLNLEPLYISIDLATPLGLILNELLSNACKHAFPDGRGGEIAITLNQTGVDRFCLSFTDNGVGIPAGFNLRGQSTYGLMSIFSLAEGQLGGQIAVDTRQGLAYTLIFPHNQYKSRV